MSAFPSLPLFTDAFIADTSHLSAAQTGAYLMLLMVAWRQEDCRLPDDDTRLARWARVDARSWPKIKAVVMEFWKLEGGYWTQKRLCLERDSVRKRADTARANGMHGGRPKSLENNKLDNPDGSAGDTQKKASISISNKISSLRSEANPPEPKESKPRKRASRIDPAWKPNEADHAFAVSVGIPGADVARHAAEFVDYWGSAGGSNAAKVDWSATWRNRCRQIAEKRGYMPVVSATAPAAGRADGWPANLPDPEKCFAAWSRGTWPGAWGFGPGDPQCRVPPAIVEEWKKRRQEAA